MDHVFRRMLRRLPAYELRYELDRLVRTPRRKRHQPLALTARRANLADISLTNSHDSE